MLSDSLFNHTILSVQYKSAAVTFQGYCLCSICNNRRMKNVNMRMGQGKYALSIPACSTWREKIMDCFPCDEYSSCKGKKRLALGVFFALALPAHLPSGSRQRLSRKAGKEPVKCRAQYAKPPGNPAKSVSKMSLLQLCLQGCIWVWW